MKTSELQSLRLVRRGFPVALSLAMFCGPALAHPDDPPPPPPDVGAPTAPNPPSHKHSHIHIRKSLGPVAMPQIPTQPQFPVARLQTVQEKEARLKSKKK
ncbi:hypothetical protein [Caldimonas tepidiphila]|uniref:hypothetical protein n=1 Tax=Caldimonas tepidiphila TaxID=2315841 RepID=UPI0013003C33|nr:hypothetical protein [Caldimonas tepidiphila]